MLIEEAVLINADRKRIWETFTDLTCWADWNSVARNAASGSGGIEQDGTITFCLRPFSVPLMIEPRIDMLVPGEKVVWSASKFGIVARHEFLFQQAANGVLVTSRESFRGLPLLFGGVAFPERTVRQLTQTMLQDLKRAAERDSRRSPGATA